MKSSSWSSSSTTSTSACHSLFLMLVLTWFMIIQRIAMSIVTARRKRPRRIFCQISKVTIQTLELMMPKIKIAWILSNWAKWHTNSVDTKPRYDKKMKVEADTDNSESVTQKKDEHPHYGFFPTAGIRLMIFRYEQETVKIIFIKSVCLPLKTCINV